MLLAADDRVGLVLDHGPHQGRLVIEVVVELGAADVRRGPHVVDGGAVDALVEDQLGSGFDDPFAGLSAPRVRPRAAGWDRTVIPPV